MTVEVSHACTSSMLALMSNVNGEASPDGVVHLEDATIGSVYSNSLSINNLMLGT